MCDVKEPIEDNINIESNLVCFNYRGNNKTCMMGELNSRSLASLHSNLVVK